jgi:hypothetical protein
MTMPVKKLRFVVVTLVLLLAGSIIFRDFVFGDKVLLYKDVGSDSINVFYSYVVHISDYLRREGFPRWSFAAGMGQSIFPFANSLLFDPVVWLKKSLIAYALVYQHLLKSIICGLLFFRFLELRRATFTSALLGALLLSFSAYMCMGATWTGIGTEVVCLTFVLFAAETAITQGRWLYVPVATACCGILTPFHLYFAALLLTVYVPARLFIASGGRFSASALTCLKLGAFAIIGVGLAACLCLDGFAVIHNSPRGSGLVSYTHKLLSFPIFGLENASHYATAIYRQFSNDMVGTGTAFGGWQNYLEAPSSYCGLICLLLAPQGFVAASISRRFLCAGFLMAVGLFTLLPWCRYMFWLFQGDYYRTLSLFVVFGLISLSMASLSRYIKNGTLNLWLVGLTYLTLLGMLFCPIGELGTSVNPHLRTLAACFLCGYVVLLVAGHWFRREAVAGVAIFVLSAAELCYFGHITVAERPTVMKSELEKRVGYNDEAVDALRDIRATDTTFYRIGKVDSSSPTVNKSLNDALVFGYYATTSYSSFNNINYIRFLMAVDAISWAPTESETRWLHGLIGRRELLSFVCEKYVLTPDPFSYQFDPAYEFVQRYGKVSVFKNKEVFPLGVFFTSYLLEPDFMRLSKREKEEVLRSALVLGQEQFPIASDLVHGHNGIGADESQRGELRLSSFRENRIAGEIDCYRPGMLVFQMPFDPGWKAYVDQVRTKTFKADIGLVGLKLGSGHHFVEMRYLPQFLPIGAAISLISLLIFSVCLWRWPRVRVLASVTQAPSR